MERETARIYLTEGNKLKRQGKLKKAIASYRKAIKINPHFSWSHHQLGATLAKRGLLDKAIISFRRAIKLNPNSAWSHYELAEVFATKGELDAAIANYRRACELEPDFGGFSRGLEIALGKLRENNLKQVAEYRAYAAQQKSLGNLDEAISGYRKAIATQPEAADYCELGLLLMETQQQWDEALLCYEKILEIAPVGGSQNKQFLLFGVALVKQGKLREVLDSYHKVFQKNVEKLLCYSQFSIYLISSGLIGEAVAFFKEFPKPKSANIENKEQLNSQINVSKYDLIWDWFNSSDRGDFNLNLNLETLESETNEIKEHFQGQTISTFVLPNLKPKHKALLRNLGVSVEYVECLNRAESHALESIYLNAFKDEKLAQKSEYLPRTLLHPHRRFRCWHVINNPVEFTHTIAEFKYMYSVDPTSGEVVRTNESFFLDSLSGLTFYRFKGKEVFYIIAGGFNGEKVALYVPRLNIAIIFIDYWPRFTAEIFKAFQSLIVSGFKDVLEYLNSSDSRISTSCLGFLQNLGHFFWQDINGVYYSYKNKLLEPIDRFAIGHYEPMELASIMPEIPESKIIKVPQMSISERFLFFLKNNCFCFRMTEHFISSESVARVRKVAFNKCSADFLQMLAEIQEKKNPFPLLWINVRSHNKSWLSQEEGYANIINKLSDDFPNLGIVVDGWIDCDRVVENLKKQLKPNIQVYNTLGCPLHESIVWGYYIDAYIAVVGSGLTITSWLNEKPGVAYANRGHLTQKRFWSEVKENGIAPDFLDDRDVVDLASDSYGNYQIEWQIIYNKILPILKKISPVKSS